MHTVTFNQRFVVPMTRAADIDQVTTKHHLQSATLGAIPIKLIGNIKPRSDGIQYLFVPHSPHRFHAWTAPFQTPCSALVRMSCNVESTFKSAPASGDSLSATCAVLRPESLSLHFSVLSGLPATAIVCLCPKSLPEESGLLKNVGSQGVLVSQCSIFLPFLFRLF